VIPPRIAYKYISLCGVLVVVGMLLFLGGLCFGLGCNLQDVFMSLVDGGSLDQLRNRPTENEVSRREAASIRLFLLSLIMLEVVVQLFGGK